MSAALPLPSDQACCIPACEDEVVQNIPGPQGEAGTNGADGEDGLNPFTFAAAGFTMPAEGANVVVATTTEITFLAIGQIVFVETAGYFEVIDLPSDFSIELQNLEDTGTGAYPGNAAPATAIGGGVKISAGGVQGAPGNASGALLIASNLSDLASPAAARTNLALVVGTNVQAFDADLTTWAGLTPSANAQSLVTAANYAAMRTQLGLVIGTNVQAWDADLDTVAGNITAQGQALIAGATALAQRATLGKVLPRYGQLGAAAAVDHNATNTDTAITIEATRYRVDKVVVENASISLTTATSGLFTAAGGAGTALANDQALAALTAATKFLDLTLQGVVGTDTFTSGTLFYRTGTAQGAAATANVFIFGWRLD